MLYYVGTPWAPDLIKVDAKSSLVAWEIYAKAPLKRSGDSISRSDIENRIEELKDDGVRVYTGALPLGSFR